MDANRSFADSDIQDSIRKNKKHCEIWMNAFAKSITKEKREYIDWLKKSVDANKDNQELPDGLEKSDYTIAKKKLKNAIKEYKQASLNFAECERIFEKYHA